MYKEFVSTFEDNPQAKVNKTWVKAGTFNAGNRKEDTAGKGQLYKPTSKFETAANLTPKVFITWLNEQTVRTKQNLTSI